MKNIQIEVEETATGNIENVNIFNNDDELKAALTSYLNAFRIVDPAYFRQTESLTSTVERTAKLNG
ncbi:hypothetical protein ACFX2L_25050, partial [Escherichia coli]|uniref:hypothetical protein n=1 Tax=Escherichia coli TaxID=562 RepID=UPI0036BC8391